MLLNPSFLRNYPYAIKISDYNFTKILFFSQVTSKALAKVRLKAQADQQADARADARADAQADA
ncbi:MAG: hypothetical protein LBF40_06480 [Deltaproteobacteria bacterium]|jgi:hypothetical protein|nr:hypothetical protein [Deltaproteobacteria bacterium]